MKRRIPKPARPERASSVTKLSQRIRMHEPIFLAGGMVLTAVSILLAAITTYISWRQIGLIIDERNTPYRVAIYSERINSYKLLAQSSAKFETSHICTAMIAKRKIRVTSKDIMDCSKTISDAVLPLIFDFNQSISFWPKDSRKAMSNYLSQASEVTRCSHPAMMRITTARSMVTECPVDIEVQLKELSKLRYELLAQLMKDLNSTIAEPSRRND